MDGNKGFKSLHFVCENRLSAGLVNRGCQLTPIFPGVQRVGRSRKRTSVHFHPGPKGSGGFVVPCIHNTTAHMFSCTNARDGE